MFKVLEIHFLNFYDPERYINWILFKFWFNTLMDLYIKVSRAKTLTFFLRDHDNKTKHVGFKFIIRLKHSTISYLDSSTYFFACSAGAIGLIVPRVTPKAYEPIKIYHVSGNKKRHLHKGDTDPVSGALGSSLRCTRRDLNFQPTVLQRVSRPLCHDTCC